MKERTAEKGAPLPQSITSHILQTLKCPSLPPPPPVLSSSPPYFFHWLRSPPFDPFSNLPRIGIAVGGGVIRALSSMRGHCQHNLYICHCNPSSQVRDSPVTKLKFD